MSFFTKSLLSVLSLSAALIQPATAKIGGYEGCFNSVANYTRTGPYIYQSDGYCVSTCKGKGLAYAATQDQLCACGQSVPPAALKVADTQCGNSCPGYPYEDCGGDNAWSLYSVANYNPYVGVSVAPAAVTSAAPTQITLPSSAPTSFAAPSSPASSSQPTEIVKKPTIQTAQANVTNSAPNGLGLASPVHAVAASILTFTAAVIPFVLYV
ncbi:WSC domain protein, putative [Paecilomyces variotii No. 5]|uniref:WSC domain protein, putative n=1 Tax=Byssochlamys spectabilis (strain No. 5 / NBRC 109023) TaxID=1356009 RepID=V5F8L9_BYSSN|nr:WSC domain protein, putative [Paecilomyces variotii No. 5]